MAAGRKKNIKIEDGRAAAADICKLQRDIFSKQLAIESLKSEISTYRAIIKKLKRRKKAMDNNAYNSNTVNSNTATNTENTVKEEKMRKPRATNQEKIKKLETQIKRKEEAIKKINAEIEVDRGKIEAIRQQERDKDLKVISDLLSKKNIDPKELIKQLVNNNDKE